MIVKRLSWLIVLIMLIANINVTAQAQVTAAPNVLVGIYEKPNAQNFYFAIFAPGTVAPKSKWGNPDPTSIRYSPDYKWQIEWGVVYGSGEGLLNYKEIGKDTKSIKVDEGFVVSTVVFSRDSRYVAYALFNYLGKRWQSAVLELAAGKTYTFTGSLGAELAGGEPGMVMPITFGTDSNTFYFLAFDQSDTGVKWGSVYKIDLSKLDASKLIVSPLKDAELAIKNGGTFTFLGTSPDGTVLTYFFNDPANPPQNNAPSQFTKPINTLMGIEVKSGERKPLVQTEKGQGLSAATWSPDNKTLYYVAGGFQQTELPVAAKLYSLDVASGKVTAGAVLESDVKRFVQTLMVCGDTLFFTVRDLKPPTDTSTITTLFSAPLTDASKRSQPLISGANVVMSGCAP